MGPSQKMETSLHLKIATDWSTLSVAEYRHPELYLLIRKWVLMHRNSGEPEKCPKSLV